MGEIGKAVLGFLRDTVSHPSDNLLAVLLLSLVAVAVAVFGIGKALDAIAKLLEYLVGAGKFANGWFKGRREKQLFLNRRKQFLRVLETDLAGIAKSEAWNDQHFTDLEAEVEVDGAYYSSEFLRLIGRKSTGLRRLPSLIRALDQSSEKCLLLVGEPGAGKSVALRHLAHQIIERAKASTELDASIPLYVNLRELVVPADIRISVDSIKKFVIDNVRRGDADTAEYISENWKEFQEKGVWIFLFDSFDEIPAVLHSAAGDDLVGDYSSAIRQFMDGLGDCRGVVASREYKSPASLQWPKLRILPLSEERQEQLVNHTFLTTDQKRTVLRHISASSTTTFRNPLFLTLLCRYVKENNAPPTSEHQLLLNHVTSLAKRDSRYVTETWGLTPEELLASAKELARLFAVDSALGLSPTFSDISLAASAAEFFSDGRLYKVLDALSYVKIGRTDVQSSDVSVRRFAFGHRRYQESLFAKVLMDDPSAIPVRDLVLDSRWREYVVAVLQVERGNLAREILKFASTYLTSRLRSLPVKSRKYFGVEIATYHWGDEELNRVLALLQEGLRDSPPDEFQELASSINAIAAPLWAKGDLYDRLQILRLCSAVRPDELSRRVEAATASGIMVLEEAGVQACRFVTSPTPRLADWVRLHILARLVTATRRFDYLRWDAVAAELPAGFEIGATMVRVRQLLTAKKVLMLYWLPIEFAARWLTVFDSDERVGSGHARVVSKVRLLGLMAGYFMVITLGALITVLRNGVQMIDYALIGLLLVLFAYFVRCVMQVRFLSTPEKLGVMHVPKAFKGFRIERKGALRGFLVILGFVVLPGALSIAVGRMFGYSDFTWQVFPLSSAGVITVLAVLAAVFVKINERSARREAEARLHSGQTLCEIISQAEDSETIVRACSMVEDGVFDDMRRAVSMLSAAGRALQRDKRNLPGWLHAGASRNIWVAMNILLKRLGTVT